MNKVEDVSESKIAEFTDWLLSTPELLKAIEVFYEFFELSNSGDCFKKILDDYKRFSNKNDTNSYSGFASEEYDRLNMAKVEVSRIMKHFINNDLEKENRFYLLPPRNKQSRLLIVYRNYKVSQDIGYLKNLVMSDFETISNIFGKPNLMVLRHDYWPGTVCYYKLDKNCHFEMLRGIVEDKIKLAKKGKSGWEFFFGQILCSTMPLPFDISSRLIVEGILHDELGFKSLLKWSNALENKNDLNFEVVKNEIDNLNKLEKTPKKLKDLRIEKIRDQINELIINPESFKRENALFLLKYRFMFFEKLSWEVSFEKAWSWLKRHRMVPTKETSIQLARKNLQDYFKKSFPEKIATRRERFKVKRKKNYIALDLTCDINLIVEIKKIKLTQGEITKLMENLYYNRNRILVIIASEPIVLRDKLIFSVYDFFIFSYAICVNYCLPWQKIQTLYFQGFMKNNLNFTDIEYESVIKVINNLSLNKMGFKVDRYGKPFDIINLFTDQGLTPITRNIQITKEELATQYESFFKTL